MNEFGLDSATSGQMRAFFAEFASVREVRVFGSRAMGTHRPGSDVDLAVYGDLNTSDLNRIKAGLEELPTPYLFDVVSYADIQNPQLKDHIDRVGVIFYNSQEK